MIETAFDELFNDNLLIKGQTDEQKKKVRKVMKEFKEGKLKSSSGESVSDRNQAVAIAMSEAGLSKDVELDPEEGGVEKGILYHRLKDDYDNIAAIKEKFPVKEFMSLLSKPETASVIDLNKLFNKEIKKGFGDLFEDAEELEISIRKRLKK